jgi:prolyl-tRNA synthetase
MKDMYSFHTTQESLNEFYNRTLQAYVKAYARCGLSVKVVQASGGIFTDNMSHEFQALTNAGEDMLIACESCDFGQNTEIATHKVGDTCPKCGGVLAQMKGVEVGNIFDLGTKYTDAFGFTYMNEKGEQKPIIMGCYGIGTSRLVGAIVEAHHDEKGMVWPKSVSPFHVSLVSLRSKDEAVQAQINQASEDLYKKLAAAGMDVLWDDRADVSPGEKFANSDLIGLPLRLVVSERMLKEGSVEWKERTASEAQTIPLVEVIAKAKELLS